MKRTEKKRFLLVFSAVLLLLLCGCQSTAPVPEVGKKISVVTTIFPPYDFAREIGGELVEVRMLIRPGTDAHSYDPTPSDMRAIENCDVFIYTGGESEAWAKELTSSLDFTEHSPQIISMLDEVDPLTEEVPHGADISAHAHSEQTQEYDEHVWTSPKNAIAIAGAVENALSKVDPVHAADYAENAATYQAQLSELDAAYRLVAKNSQKKYLLFADRFPFRYLAEEYGLSAAAAFPGCSSESEPSVKTMAYLIDTVKEEQLPYIFTVERSNRSIAQTISDETGAGILQMHSCHTLSAQELARGESYLSLMYQNLETLKRGLQYVSD